MPFGDSVFFQGTNGNDADPYASLSAGVDTTTPQYAYGNAAVGGSTFQDRYSSMQNQANLYRTGQSQLAPSTNYAQANADYANYGGARMGNENAAYDAMAARGEQQQAMGLERAAAYGQAPSVAQNQLAYGLAQGVASNQAMANSARGGGANLAAAQRAAVQGNTQLAGQTNYQNAMLRAGEMAQARGAYSAGAAGIRSQDLGQQQAWQGQQGVDLNARAQSAQQAQFGTQAQLQYQNQNTQAALGYEQLANQTAQAQLQADIAKRQAEEGHWQQQAALDQHRTDQDTSLWSNTVGGLLQAFSDEQLKTDISSIGGGGGIVRENPYGSGPSQPTNNVDWGGMASKFGTGMQQQNGGAGSSLGKGLGGFLRSDAHSKEQIKALTAENEMMRQGINAWRADPAVDKALQERAARLKVQQALEARQREVNAHRIPEAGFVREPAPAGFNTTHVQEGFDRPIGPAVDVPITGPTERPYEPVPPRAAEPVAMSDERTKGGKSSAPMGEFMDHLDGYSYRYKPGTPGEDETKPRVGIMAQDVEKSPVGATIVEDTPVGKAIDVKHGFGTALAAIGDLHDRVKRLEYGRKGKK